MADIKDGCVAVIAPQRCMRSHGSGGVMIWVGVIGNELYRIKVDVCHVVHVLPISEECSSAIAEWCSAVPTKKDNLHARQRSVP